MRVCLMLLLFPLLLLLHLLFSCGRLSGAAAAVGNAGGGGGGARNARLPEHTCHKVIGRWRCDPRKCRRECSKEPNGIGVCRDRNIPCLCTYFCKQPPL